MKWDRQQPLPLVAAVVEELVVVAAAVAQVAVVALAHVVVAAVVVPSFAVAFAAEELNQLSIKFTTPYLRILLY